MARLSEFADKISKAYETTGPAIDLGRGVLNEETDTGARVQIPLSMVNRHGLIAGATGTGKTRTLQILAEGLSANGVPCVVADVKGDLSGLLEPGDPSPEGPAAKRAAKLGVPFEPAGFPTELYSIGGIGPGVPIRATVSDFGPQLLAKILGANETQEQSLALVFHYADGKGLPLLDLEDLRSLLTFLTSKEGKADLEGIGGLSKATAGVLLRSLLTLDPAFFGEPQLDVADLMRVAPDGRGVISCVELAAVQDKPQLWSTVLMWLVAELFETLPEAGDLPKPKLVVFLDEAHLLFDDATGAFVDAIEQTVRLIRSKGVGVFFITQVPTDVAPGVLAQLGNRVQHALRAFTPQDAKALKATVSTFPKSDLYDLGELLPALGIGEAVVTILDEDGVPTPVVHTKLSPPRAKMGPATTLPTSPLMAKYGTAVDRESAKELLAKRVTAATAAAPPRPREEHVPLPRDLPPRQRTSTRAPADPYLQIKKEIVRGVFGMLRKRF
jgi:DNA helicase HerA-like ATPase